MRPQRATGRRSVRGNAYEAPADDVRNHFSLYCTSRCLHGSLLHGLVQARRCCMAWYRRSAGMSHLSAALEKGQHEEVDYRCPQVGRVSNVVEGRPWPLQRPVSPPLTIVPPQTPQHSPHSQVRASAAPRHLVLLPPRMALSCTDLNVALASGGRLSSAGQTCCAGAAGDQQQRPGLLRRRPHADRLCTALQLALPRPGDCPFCSCCMHWTAVPLCACQL
jgi:hypothetical protein